LLFIAIVLDSSRMVQLLIELGVAVDTNFENFCDFDANSPLLLASAVSSPSVVQALLDAKANVNARNLRSDVSLHFAAMYNPRVTSLLLGAKAEVDAKTWVNYTPLHLAARHTGDCTLVDLLLKAGADPNSQGKDGETPLHRAMYSDHHMGEIIMLLVSSGADITLENENEETPMDLALIFGMGREFRILFDIWFDRKEMSLPADFTSRFDPKSASIEELVEIYDWIQEQRTVQEMKGKEMLGIMYRADALI
jgi:uncharacterized protein